jgi:hypothetical protein
MLILQTSKLPLHRRTAAVQTLEAVAPTSDPREQPAAQGDGKHRSLALRSAEWDDGLNASLFDLRVDASDVVPLVESRRLGLEPSRLDFVEQLRDEERLVMPRCAGLPGQGKSRPSADRKVDLVSVEASALSRADRRAMPPRRIRIGEPLAELASVTDVALTVRPSAKVGGVDCYVAPKIRVNSAQRLSAGVEALAEDVQPLLEPAVATAGSWPR